MKTYHERLDGLIDELLEDNDWLEEQFDIQEATKYHGDNVLKWLASADAKTVRDYKIAYMLDDEDIERHARNWAMEMLEEDGPCDHINPPIPKMWDGR